MRLQQVGELNLLKEIRKKFSFCDSSVIVGIGDDAAVIAPQKDKIVVTTDMMNEGVHFDLSFTSFYHLGFKLVSVNVSDIFAMGAMPKYLFLNIALSRDLDEDSFWQLYKGILRATNIYNVNLIGGDLCSSRNDIILSATVMGVAERVITRGNASVGENIYVTGNIGDSSCGLAILKNLTEDSKEVVKAYLMNGSEKNIKDKYLSLLSSKSINFDRAEPLLKRHLMPIARNLEKITPYITSMIDISDGLFVDLYHICEESNVGAKIYFEKIPCSEEMLNASEILKIDLLSIISGGEDYEMLFTAPKTATLPSIIENVCPVTGKVLSTAKITCIGEVIKKEEGMVIVDKTGSSSAIQIKGYQHFLSEG
jgi:thiamine-monophosphate kinase